MTLAELHNLQPADVLITPKSDIRLIKHFVVFQGYDSQGTDYYLENKQGFGVRQINGAQFQRENTILSIRKFSGNTYQRDIAIQRGTSLLGRTYDLANFNCEHYANYIQYNTPISKQVDFVKGMLGTAVAVTFIGILIGALSD
jgi:hypothetical protein